MRLPSSIRFALHSPTRTQRSLCYGLNESTLEAGVALTKLGAAGYAQVTTLPGGLEGWKAGGGKIEQSAAPELPSGNFEVDQQASLVEWTGRNLFNRHAGTVQLGPGQVLIKDGRLAGGHLTVDMTSLRCTDIPDPAMNAHLRSRERVTAHSLHRRYSIWIEPSGVLTTVRQSFFGRLGQHIVNDEFHLQFKVVTKDKPSE